MRAKTSDEKRGGGGGVGGGDRADERKLSTGKRSGVDAVKLHLETTNDRTGRTSRSADAVRKTSIRMTAIKEYPFDLSDLKEQTNGDVQQANSVPPPNTIAAPVTHVNAAPAAPAANDTAPAAIAGNNATPAHHSDGKRRVSILTEAGKGYDNHGFERSRKISDGPAHRKIFHNAHQADIDDKNGLAARYYNKKCSNASSVTSKGSKRIYVQAEPAKTSWWYSCCQKFHQDDSDIPSWEPTRWRKFCPYPLCPTYRQFAQNLSLFILGILAWVILICLTGKLAEPGGILFEVATLAILAHLGGWLMVKITTLPALIGMLLMGVALRNTGVVQLGGDFGMIAACVRKIALTIILTRAGLDLDPPAMKKLFLTVLKLGLVPWIAEFVIIAIMTHYLLELPWIWAFLLGSVTAAVSPAVVVPCLFRLRERGFGVAKGIPTLVLAVSGIDDAASVAVFGIIAGLMFSDSSTTMSIVQGPASILIGVGSGVVCGYLVKYIPERSDPFLVPLRVLLLLAGGLVAVLGSEEVGWGGSGPLAVITFSFMSIKHWTEMGWDAEDNPVATAFEIFWMIFEPLLFSITGAGVLFRNLELHLVLVGGGCLVTGVVLRILITAGIGFRSNLNTKEKFFVGLSWMAKATVQAALGTVALDAVAIMVSPEKDTLHRYAYIVQTMCTLSIVLTAPLGAILITLTGPRMLTKTTKPAICEGWRRSHRPSMRDISIIDEDEVAERDAEAGRSFAPDPARSSVTSSLSGHVARPSVPASLDAAATITVQPGNHAPVRP